MTHWNIQTRTQSSHEDVPSAPPNDTLTTNISGHFGNFSMDWQSSSHSKLRVSESEFSHKAGTRGCQQAREEVVKSMAACEVVEVGACGAVIKLYGPAQEYQVLLVSIIINYQVCLLLLLLSARYCLLVLLLSARYCLLVLLLSARYAC